jgi:hypothetical protein
VQESPKPAAPKQPNGKPERPPVVKAASDPVIAGAPAPLPGEAAPGYVARGKLDLKLDPFDPANERKFTAGVAEQQNLAQNLLARGDAEFKQKHYAQAKQLYEQAFQSDSRLQSQEARNAWAYCQLALVVENVNRYPEQPCDWARLEADVKQAVQAAPHLAKSGETILADMMKRRAAVPADLTRAAPAVAVKHLPRGEHGWLVAETSHFRVFHKQSSDYAEKVVQVAENTRVQMSRKWFGKNVADWTLKCDIYLHATAADYSQFTRESAASPGHSRIELDPTNGRVVSRQVHMRCDNPAMLEAILPHETTHVVLAGNFGSKHVPRWVDEGVAVLTEPPEKVQQHRKNLVTSLQNRELIPLRDLMQLDNYPQPRQVATFYAQSVTLVDFLTRQKGPQVFTQFVREALRDGYEPALRKNYGFQGFAELQDRFTERILAEAKGSGAAYAER